MGLVLAIMFLGMYFLIIVLSPLTRYGPGQLFNPFRLAENLVIGLFFFLMIWKMPTVNQSLTWSLILLSLYNGGYIAGFISDTILFRTLDPIDIAVGLMHGLALGICGFVLLRPLDAREAIRVVYGTALFSWAITVVSYVTFYGPEVGIGRALVTGVLGPFIVIIVTTIRTRGNWVSRETESRWEYSKHLDWEKWTSPHAEVIKGDIDSYDRTSRNVDVHTCRFGTGEKCVDRVLTMSDSVGKLTWDEIDEFSGEDAHLLVKGDQIIDVSFWGRPMREDPPILHQLHELCSRMQVYDVDTNWLFWKHSKVPVSKWPHQQRPPYLLLLDESLAGKLEPQEWMPLIASAVTFHSKLWKRRLFGNLPVLLFTAASSLIMILVLDAFLRRFIGPETQAYLLLLAGALCVSAIGSLKLQARMNLKADKLVTGLTGKSILLEALTRVEAAKPTLRKSRIEGFLSHLFSSEPSIEERISSIRK